MRTRLRPLLVVVFFGLTAVALLLFANPSAYAEPLQQGVETTITPIPTDTAGGAFTIVNEAISSSLGLPQMDVDSDGNPVILYTVNPFVSGDSVLIWCSDPNCTNRTTTTLMLGRVIDLVLQPSQNGLSLPIIMYQAGTLAQPGSLRIDRCDDPVCTTRTSLANIPNATANSGAQPLLAVTQGPYAAYKWAGLGGTPQSLGYSHCNVIPCSTSVPDAFTGTSEDSIWLDHYLGFPVVAYNTINGITIANCGALYACLNPKINSVVSFGPIGEYGRSFMMAINENGQPVVIYYGDFRQLRIATCGDLSCSTVASDTIFEELPLTGYGYRDMDFGANGDLFVAYDRVDLQDTSPNSTAYKYLLLRRCNQQACTLRNLTSLPGSGYLNEMVVRDNRTYVLYATSLPGSQSNGLFIHSIHLYVGDQPSIPEPTPGPSPTYTLTRTPDSYDLTVTAGATYYTPSITRTPTPTQRLFPTNPVNWTVTPSPTVTGTLSETPLPTATRTSTLTWTPSVTYTPTFTPSSPPNIGPQRNRSDISIVTLRWMPVANATGYEIHVARSAAFNPTIFADNSLPASQVSINTTPLPNGTYYWRVRARYLNGTWGAWSQVDTFVVAAPPTPSA
ncbi:MAG: hypothetical protein J0M33_10765 [Anaerolineae bacterium]|nr:hypothetical protein [Anaerolineae bacterium]